MNGQDGSDFSSGTERWEQEELGQDGSDLQC